MRLVKKTIAKIWRRFNYHIIYLCILILVYNLLTRRTYETQSRVNLDYVTVHFDFKGSPPKLSYIISLLPMLKMYGVNSILVEYEDMFPYEGHLENVSSENCYKKYELIKFIDKARRLKIEIIPLIQTFGHMEYVLKMKEFAHLREQEQYLTDICPTNPASKQLIASMLEQVIDLHARVYPLKHIHIGCDEVYNINMCQLCKERRLKTTDLFADHVEEVSLIVKKLSPFTKVLIWGDMLLKTITPQKLRLSSDIEVVTWEYGSHPKFSHTYFYNLHKNFNKIWIASAFKGADGRSATIPNITTRFKNHLSWMKFIIDYKFGGEVDVYNFKGIILTGWSRYSHMAPQCELLPLAIPSLILNLLLIRTVRNGIDYGDLDNLNACEFFNKYLNKDFEEYFLISEDNNKKCAFENTFVYKKYNNIFSQTLLHDCFSRLHEFESECYSLDETILRSTFTQCKRVLQKLLIVRNEIESLMAKYYEVHTIQSYVNQTILSPVKNIKKIMKYLWNCTSERSIIL